MVQGYTDVCGAPSHISRYKNGMQLDLTMAYKWVLTSPSDQERPLSGDSHNEIQRKTCEGLHQKKRKSTQSVCPMNQI